LGSESCTGVNKTFRAVVGVSYSDHGYATLCAFKFY
jgi:hypothetical protein